MSDSLGILIWDEGSAWRGSLDLLAGTIPPKRCLTRSLDELRRIASEVESCVVIWGTPSVVPSNGSSLSEWLKQTQRPPTIVIADEATVEGAVWVMRHPRTDVFRGAAPSMVLGTRIQEFLGLDCERRKRWRQLQEIQQRFASLTDREAAVLELLLQGHPNKMMASRLKITERAIEMRRSSLMKKLAAEGLGQVFDQALRREFLGQEFGVLVNQTSHLPPDSTPAIKNEPAIAE